MIFISMLLRDLCRYYYVIYVGSFNILWGSSVMALKDSRTKKAGSLIRGMSLIKALTLYSSSLKINGIPVTSR